MQNFFVYILETSGNTLYTGITTDLSRRVLEHNSHTKKSAKYTRTFKNCKLVYSEQLESRSNALKREAEIKKFTRSKKLDLIRNS